MSNPGSKEARSMGCKCPVRANNAGSGFAFIHPSRGHRHAEYVVSTACRLHWQRCERATAPAVVVDGQLSLLGVAHA